MKSKINNEKKSRRVYHDLNLQIIFSVTLIAVLGVSSIAPAFPKMIQELNISPDEVGLLVIVFTLPGVFLTLPLGVFADRFGRKKTLVPSLILFGIAGGACFFVRDFDLLLILRFLQGIGAAPLGSLNITIIGDIYSNEELISAMGYNAGFLSVGTASYPAIGGALAMIGWYYPFLLPFSAIPIGILVTFFLKNPEPKNTKGFSNYARDVWDSIKNRRAIGLFIISILTFMILYGGYLTFFPLLLDVSYGSSSFIIGILMSSVSIVTAFASSQVGKLVRKLKEKNLLKIASILYACSMILIPFIPNIWLILIPIAVFGVAHGINIPVIHTLLAKIAPVQHRGAFMSVNGMVLRLGQTLGPLFMGIIFATWQLIGVFYASSLLSICIFLIILLSIK